MKFYDMNDKTGYRQTGGFSQWGQQLTRAHLHGSNVPNMGRLDSSFQLLLGARESVAAHGLHRPTRQRPAADSPSAEPTQRWCSDCGKGRANVTGKSARTVGLHPSWALGLDSTEAASRWSGRTSPVTLPNLARTNFAGLSK